MKQIQKDMDMLTEAALDERSEMYIDCFDGLKSKYGIGFSLDGELGTKRILSVYASVATGQEDTPKLIRMYSDEMMAEVLDEDDMAVWHAKKAEYLRP